MLACCFVLKLVAPSSAWKGTWTRCPQGHCPVGRTSELIPSNEASFPFMCIVWKIESKQKSQSLRLFKDYLHILLLENNSFFRILDLLRAASVFVAYSGLHLHCQHNGQRLIAQQLLFTCSVCVLCQPVILEARGCLSGADNFSCVLIIQD